MVHSIPLRVFMYGHWDDHAVDEIFLSLYKRGIHYTILTWRDLKEKMTWLDLTWTIMWLDLTWLEKTSNDLTWLGTRVLLTWLDLWLERGWLVTTLVLEHAFHWQFMIFNQKTSSIWIVGALWCIGSCSRLIIRGSWVRFHSMRMPLEA